MSEVKDRSATPHVRRVVVKPQPLLARLCQNAVTWITLAIAGGAALLWGGTPPWASQFIHVSVWLAGFLWVLRLVLLRRSELVVNSLSAPGVLLVSYAIVRYGLAEVEPVVAENRAGHRQPPGRPTARKAGLRPRGRPRAGSPASVTVPPHDPVPLA